MDDREKEMIHSCGRHNRQLSDLFQSPAIVLLAEEDDAVREAISRGLAREGFRVIAVEDGLELCDYLALASVPGSRVPLPDVIVADETLHGLNGLGACEYVRRRRAPPPCVLLTSHFDAETVRRAREIGVADVLPKPVEVDELTEAVALLTS